MDYRNVNHMVYVVIPIIIIIIAYVGYSKKERILKTLKLNTKLKGRFLSQLLLVIGLTLIFYSYLGPQKEIGSKEITGQGLDIYVLMDTSKSMLAEDALPSRLEHSKKIVSELLERLKGHRIGLIPYASSAYIQMPLTDDYDMTNMFLNVMDTDMVGGGGTDVSQAIELALDSFADSGANNQVILILSDGEEFSADMSQIKKDIEATNVHIFTVGVGSLEGGLIPLYDQEGQLKDYKKDDDGNYITTRLETDLLREIALNGGGRYYTSDASLSEIEGLINDLSALDTAETTTKRIKEYKQLYQWFLAGGLICLFISLKLYSRRFDI